MDNENFISQTELNDYKKSNRYFNRHGVKINSNGIAERLTKRGVDGNIRNIAVEDEISDLVNSHIKSSSQSKLITVEMYEEDGLSWFSQKLYDSKKSVYSQFHFFNINDSSKDTYKLPIIAYEIGVKKFIQSAIKNKICSDEGFKFMLKFPTWLYLFLSAIFALIVQFAVTISPSSKSISANSFFNLNFFLLFVALVGLSVLSKFLNEKSVLQSEAKSMKRFSQQLDEVSKDIQNNPKSNNKNKFDAFINDIVEKLKRKELPRFFIVDNFSRLDFVTRSVIKRYWKNNLKESKVNGKEIWIVMESRNNNEKLSTLLIQDKSLINFIGSFTQLRVEPFTEEEKEKLVDVCNVDKSCAEFAYARYICNGQAKNQTWILEELHGKDKHLLNLLYLLSIAQVPVNEETISNISQNGYCKNILTQFIGEECNNLKLKKYFQEITVNFKNLLVENENKPLKDTYFTMQQNENTLQISNHKLGHIFGALYWGHLLKNTPYDVYWVQKLSYHLVNSDVSLLPQEYISQLIDYSIYAIEGNLNFGTVSDVYKLLDITKDLLLSSKTDDKAKCNKFIFLCWQCYILCKDERMLKLFIELADKTKDTASTNQNTDIALQLYLELLPIAVLGKEQAVKDFESWLSNYSDADFLIRYMKLQSIWLALSVTPMNWDFNTILISEVANQSSSDIDAIFNAIIQSNHSYKTATIFDLISISVLLWIDCFRIYDDILLRLKSTSHKINSNYLKTSFAKMVDDFSRVIEYLKEKGFVDEPENLNYFEKAIIGEITLTILSSLTASYECIKKSPYGETSLNYYTSIFNYTSTHNYTTKIQDSELLVKINSQIEDINKIIQFDLPKINKLDDLSCAYFADTIENNFNFQSLIWQKINLSEFGYNLIIKRIQYNILTKERDVEATYDNANIISAIYEAAKKQTQIGVLANIVIANYLEKIAQLSSYYFIQAGDIMIKEQFGNKMIREISLLTIVYFNDFKTDLSRFAATITEDSNTLQEDNYLFNILTTIPEEQFFNVLLRLSNSSNNIQDDAVSKKFNKLIRSYPDNIKSDRLKKRSKALFEYVEVSEQIIKNNSTNATEVIRTWADKRDYFMYAALLGQLINNGCFDENIKRETITTMKRPQDPNGNYNSYLHLAIAYAKRLRLSLQLNNDHITNDEWDYIIDYMYNPKIEMNKNNCFYWEPRENAHTNKEMYDILTHFYPNEEIFAKKSFYWGLKVSEIEHKQLIPNLLQQGHFFLLFKKYTEDMLQHKLPINKEPNLYIQERDIEEITKQDRVKEWLQQNNGIPTPIINGNCVCAEFLIIGSYFFSRSLFNADIYKEHRNRFDEMAQQYMIQLIDLILQTPQTPEYYKDIIRDMYSGLQNYRRLKK